MEPIINESGKVIGWKALALCGFCATPAGGKHTDACEESRKLGK